MKKILFIEKKLRTDKLGFLYLSASLKNAGHSVDMIQDDVESVDDYITSHPIDFAMYSVTTGEHLWFIEKNRQLKQRHQFKAVVGGPHFTFFPEQGMEDSCIDHVVQGPGETAVLDIVEGRTDQKFIKGEIPDLNSLLLPDRSILYKYDEFGKAPMKRFIATRFCIYNCKYCFNHLYKKIYKDDIPKMLQRPSPDKIINEIIKVRDEYGLKTVYFNDDDLPGDRNWLTEFCTKYKEKINLPYCGSMRANSVNREIIKMMADSGCTFMNTALESANPETQKYLRRGSITNAQVEDACNLCKEFGIKVRLQNMIGLPVDNPLKDAMDTLSYNIRINPTDSGCSIFQPFPKTDLWKETLKKGLITEQTQSINFFEKTALNIKDAEKINRLHKWWFYIVKYQIPIELVDILIELPLTEALSSRIQNIRWDIAKKLLYLM